MGGSMVFHLTKKQLRPFLSVGAGFIDDIATDGNLPGTFSDLYWDLGGGLKYYKQTGWGVRLDIHDIVAQKTTRRAISPTQRSSLRSTTSSPPAARTASSGKSPTAPSSTGAKRWLHNVAISLSVDFPFGWVWKDGDGDNVETRFDKCPSTAPSVVVDAVGCGIDTDGDGVFDGIDTCANTPKGATVDHLGCPADADSDGVFSTASTSRTTRRGAPPWTPRASTTTRTRTASSTASMRATTRRWGAIVDAHGCTARSGGKTLCSAASRPLSAPPFEPGSDELDPRSLPLDQQAGAGSSSAGRAPPSDR